MAKTVDQVAAELIHLGYPMTKRKLIDWVQKELLPKPTQRGLGRGKGSVYYWPQPDIVSRAVAVCNLLERRRRVDWVYLPLWCLGYEIPTEKVRKLLRYGLNDFEAGLLKGNSEKLGLEDWFGDVVWRVVAHMRRRQSKLSEEDGAFFEVMLNAFANPDYEPDETMLDDAAQAFIQSAESSKHTIARGFQPVDRYDTIPVILSFVQKHMSLPKMRQALVQASDREIKQAHRDWRTLINNARLFTTYLPRIAGPNELIDMLAVACGPTIIVLDLTLRYTGYEAAVDRFIEAVNDFVQRVASDKQLQFAIRQGQRQ